MIKITKREEEICQLVAKGYLDKEIAYMLGIAYYTVRLHLCKIKKKFKVPNRTLLALKYLYDRGIILYALAKGQEYVDRFKEVEDENTNE